MWCQLIANQYLSFDRDAEIEGAKITFSENNEFAKREKQAMATNQNVSASFSCFGSLLTFSFVAKSPTVVKCYLYWNGQGMRFFPEDIRTVLPKIFDLDSHGNREFLQRPLLARGTAEAGKLGRFRP